MVNGREWSRVTARTASEICRRFEMSPEVQTLRLEELSPREFVSVAIEKGHHPDAIRFLAHALPKPEAIRWGWLCARSTSSSPEDRAAAEALEQTEKWLRDPTEENRRTLMAAAQTAGFATPAGAVSLAAFLSGGSLAPPDVAPVPPPEELTGQAVAAAGLLSGVFREPQKAVERYREFLAQGVRIAEGADEPATRR